MNDLSNFNENFWNVTYDNIKGHKKHCFTLSVENTFLENLMGVKLTRSLIKLREKQSSGGYTDSSPTGQFPDWTVPRLTLPRRTFPQLDISPLRHFPER